MLERLYYYRGFEIGVLPQPIPVSAQADQLADQTCYRCIVRICKPESVLCLDSFTLERSGNRPFEDEFEAVLNGCFAAERRINMHRAISAREPHLVDAVC
jgi:hypothetical protein